MTALQNRHVSPRRAARHPKVAHLIAVDEHAMTDLELLVATLPMCATGRIFIEVPDASWITEIAAPQRMTVTWLDRSRRSGAAGTGAACKRGVALSRATIAWADEMLGDPEDETTVTVLSTYLATADIVEHMRDTVGHAPERITTPAQYNLV